MSTIEVQEADAGSEELVTDAADGRRRALRRKLPFGRGAVLQIGGRPHIVGLADLSVTGAYLSTRAPLAVGEEHLLRLVLPGTIEVELRAQVVRIAAEVESPDHPRGAAVRFIGLDDETTTRLQAFIERRLSAR